MLKLLLHLKTYTRNVGVMFVTPRNMVQHKQGMYLRYPPISFILRNFMRRVLFLSDCTIFIQWLLWVEYLKQSKLWQKFCFFKEFKDCIVFDLFPFFIFYIFYIHVLLFSKPLGRQLIIWMKMLLQILTRIYCLIISGEGYGKGIQKVYLQFN